MTPNVCLNDNKPHSTLKRKVKHDKEAWNFFVFVVLVAVMMFLLTRKDHKAKQLKSVYEAIRNITLASRLPTFSGHFTKRPVNRLSKSLP